MQILVAPTERPPITSLGPTSSVPEQAGVDLLWSGSGGMIGVQRKDIMDLVASVRDGRLGRELQQMASANLKGRFVIIEGTPAWDTSGHLRTQYTAWSRRQQWGVELSIQRQGAFVLNTRTPTETVAAVEYLYEWSQKPEHLSSLLARPGPAPGSWGKLTDKNTAIHVLSGFPGISIELAARIYDEYGRVPCRHDIIEKSLTGIDGIGPKRAANLQKVLG